MPMQPDDLNSLLAMLSAFIMLLGVLIWHVIGTHKKAVKRQDLLSKLRVSSNDLLVFPPSEKKIASVTRDFRIFSALAAALALAAFWWHLPGIAFCLVCLAAYLLFISSSSQRREWQGMTFLELSLGATTLSMTYLTASGEKKELRIPFADIAEVVPEYIGRYAYSPLRLVLSAGASSSLRQELMFSPLGTNRPKARKVSWDAIIPDLFDVDYATLETHLADRVKKAKPS